MPWKPYQDRSDKIKSLVIESAKLPVFNMSPEEFYNQFDYGLMNDDQVVKKLLSVHGTSRNMSQKKSDPESGFYSDLLEHEASQVHSLKYLTEHAQSKADREWAMLLHDELLIKLWMQYVEETGETYYPSLSDDLFEEYILNRDSDIDN